MQSIIISGGGKNGSSRYIANKINQRIVGSELVDLQECNITFCDGCLSCDNTHVCHIDDDMNRLIRKLESSDLIIFVSPARWNLLSGNLKVFMDRLNPTAVIGSLNGKKVAIFAVGQTSVENSDSLKNVVTSMQYFCDSAEMQVVYSSIIDNCLTLDKTKAKSNDIEKSIDNLLQIIREG